MHRTDSWGALPKRLADADGDPARAADALLDTLSEGEILRTLSGSRHLHQEIAAGLTGRYNHVPYPAGDIPRLAVPGVRFSDGPRGAVVGRSTAFPCSMARGATFDPELEARVGDTIGKELTAQGANYFGGVCVNLLRHPAWGRAQETYGEDSLLLGEMGAALTRGAGAHTATCTKHYACNSMENSRFRVDVRIAEADLRDFYLPHFRRCVEAGVDAVMSSYNKVNGEWCGHHRHLLTEVLREEWGFDGLVMSDFFFGVRDMAAAVNAGLDLEMPMRWRGFGLKRAIRQGRMQRETARQSAFRIARTMFAACLRTGATTAERGVVACDAHLALAREVAQRSAVLLQNNDCDGRPVLPIRVGTVALIGRLANLANTGDLGSSKVRPPHVVTAAEGFAAAAPRHGIQLRASLSDDCDVARKAAQGADAAVVVVGNTWREEGEYLFVFGGDRRTLALSPSQVRLIQTAASACPRTVVVLAGGSAFVTEPWRRQVPAILMAWFNGAQGGHALADIVFGDCAPGGRLPCTWPESEGQLPPFRRKTKEIAYGPLHGYRLFHANNERPTFGFGHGLNYVPIEWGAPALRETSGGTYVEVPLRNPAAFSQRETVQGYIDLALGTHGSALPALAGFQSIAIPPGGECVASVRVDDALRRRACKGAAAYAGHSAFALIPAGVLA